MKRTRVHKRRARNHTRRRRKKVRGGKAPIAGPDGRLIDDNDGNGLKAALDLHKHDKTSIKRNSSLQVYMEKHFKIKDKTKEKDQGFTINYDGDGFISDIQTPKETLMYNQDNDNMLEEYAKSQDWSVKKNVDKKISAVYDKKELVSNGYAGN